MSWIEVYHQNVWGDVPSFNLPTAYIEFKNLSLPIWKGNQLLLHCSSMGHRLQGVLQNDHSLLPEEFISHAQLTHKCKTVWSQLNNPRKSLPWRFTVWCGMCSRSCKFILRIQLMWAGYLPLCTCYHGMLPVISAKRRLEHKLAQLKVNNIWICKHRAQIQVWSFSDAYS